MTSIPVEMRPDSMRITRLAAGGDGIGRLEDGRVVFVEGGVPGDLVELEDLQFGKRMAKARVGKVIEASPDRTQPRCAHFGECGGCTWQQIRYEAQLDAKRSIIRDALERIGGIDLNFEFEILGSPDSYNYRTRARLSEMPEGLGYRRRGSRECIAVTECPILVPSAQAKLDELTQRALTKSDDKGCASGERKGKAEKEWEILVGSKGVAEAARIEPRLDSRQTVSIDVLGESLVASVGSFVQGNALLWDALAEEVRKQCLFPVSPVSAPLSSPLSLEKEAGSRVDSRPRFVELFAGIGFLTVPLARAGCRGVVFESGRAALRDLSKNLGRSGFAKDVEVVGGRVERRGDWVARFSRADFLLIDPPRVGLDSRLREAIAAAGPPRIVYVSCDPATLARDLRELISAGYRIESMTALDLFPQTAHVEVVTRLEREPIEEPRSRRD